MNKAPSFVNGWYRFLACVITLAVLTVGQGAFATDPTVWDSVTGFVSENSPLLVTALLAIFGIPVAFAIFRLCKAALNKAA